jgi:hypothetical protein
MTGGDPVFRGTPVPVHLIAELASEGTKAAELMESHPRLTAEMIRLGPFMPPPTRCSRPPKERRASVA